MTPVGAFTMGGDNCLTVEVSAPYRHNSKTATAAVCRIQARTACVKGALKEVCTWQSAAGNAAAMMQRL